MATLLARHLRIEADGRRCRPGAADYEPPSPPRLSTTYNIEFRCEAPIGTLRVTDDSFDVIGRDAHTLLRVSVDGRREPLASAVLLADENRTVEFEIGEPDRAAQRARPGQPPRAGADWPGARGVVPSGGCRWGSSTSSRAGTTCCSCWRWCCPAAALGTLVRIVTAFTIAHSLTLAAAALGLISVPAAPVEALIALSIAWVAAENLTRVRPMSRRWVVAFAFGLIHGFGFSNVLRDIGLPRDALLSSLMWFNLGIELGQVLVVLLLVPALAWLARLRVGKSGAPGPVGADPRYQCRVAGAEALSGKPS